MYLKLITDGRLAGRHDIVSPALGSHGCERSALRRAGDERDLIVLLGVVVRLYDPILGRFLSPDTIVPDPTNPQDFNRYSYVRNNPVNYTDPTGHVVNAQDVKGLPGIETVLTDWDRDAFLDGEDLYVAMLQGRIPLTDLLRITSYPIYGSGNLLSIRGINAGVGYGGNRIAEFRALIAPPPPPPSTPPVTVTLPSPSPVQVYSPYDYFVVQTMAAIPPAEALAAEFLASRVGITLTELLIAETGFVQYNRGTNVIIYEGTGGFSRATQLFEAFVADKADLVRIEETGVRLFRFADDVMINVRPFSRPPNSTPTLEIQTPELTYKFRFK